MRGNLSLGESAMHAGDPGKGFPRSFRAPEWKNRESPDFRARRADFWRDLALTPSLWSEFLDITRRHPERIAVAGSEVMTYAELAERVGRAAQSLWRRGLRPRDLVVIVANNDWRNLAACLAVLRNRGCCLLVSPHQNPATLAAATGALQGGWLLVDSADPQAERLAASATFPGMTTADLPAIFDCADDPGWNAPAEDGFTGDAPAFLFLTSGSTGAPRLVRMGHRFILSDIGRQINDLAIAPSDRFDLLFSPTFSAVLAPIFGALLSGASLWIRSLHEGVPDDLFQWLQSREITISTQSVSLMRSLLSPLPPGEHWPALRLLSVGGEPLHRSDIALFQSRIGAHAVLQNAMASTETRTYAQYFVTGGETLEESVPIGYAVLDREVVVVDEQGEVQAADVIGELEVRGSYLADGYCVATGSVDDESLDRTAFRLLDDGRFAYRTGDLGCVDPDGLLRWVARKDSMVKIRGQKVYLQQVEAILTGMEDVSEALVTVLDDGDGTLRTVAAVRTTKPVREEHLRRQCRQKLDVVAVPSQIVSFASFPRTDTGKVDRITLARLLVESIRRDARVETRDAAAIVPRYPLSQDVGHRLVEEVTQQRVSEATHLADLDIDSLTRLRIAQRVAERLGRRLSQEAIQGCETVRDLSEAIRDAPEMSWRMPIWTESNPTVEVTLFTSIAGSVAQFDSLFEHLLTDGESSRAFSLSVVETASLSLADDRPLTMEAFARPFVDRLSRGAKRVPQVLAGYSWGGLLAYEIACQMSGLGCPIAEVVLIDTVMRAGLPRGGLRQWARRARNLPRWLWHDGMAMGIPAWKDGIRRNMHRIAGRRGNDRNAFADSAYHQQYVAADHYLPPHYHGSVHVLRATSQSVTRPLVGALGWERFVTPAPQSVAIPGNHLTILGDRYSRRIAAALADILRQTPSLV